MATSDQRQHLAALMRWTAANQQHIHYSQARPMSAIHLLEQHVVDMFKAGQAITMDCSSGVTQLCKWAGLADPNGRAYDGYGFTGTLLDNQALKHYTDPSKANVGALVVFGPNSGEHAAMVLEPGKDPLLWSHGGEGGPVLVRLSAEQKFHQPPTTFLAISTL